MTAELVPALDLPLPPEPGVLETFRRGRLMRSDPLTCTQRMYESEGPVVGQRMGLFRSVNLFGPDAVKHVLLNREGIFSNKRAWDLIIGKIFTNGLMLRDGEDHRNQRSIMQGAFKRPALEEYLAHMNPQIAARLFQQPGDALDRVDLLRHLREDRGLEAWRCARCGAARRLDGGSEELANAVAHCAARSDHRDPKRP